mgnify:CR=1 FL=1
MTTEANASKGVALVMMDDRPPDLGSWLRQHGGASSKELNLKSQAQLVTMLTAYLNMRYACRHGYTLLFYLLEQAGCEHPLWGARHPSYCKLTAIGEALAQAGPSLPLSAGQPVRHRARAAARPVDRDARHTARGGPGRV